MFSLDNFFFLIPQIEPTYLVTKLKGWQTYSSVQRLFIQEVKGKWSVMVLLALHQWPHLSYRDGSYAWYPLFLTLDEKREDLKLALLSQKTKGSIGEVLFGHLKTFVIRLPWCLSGKESSC